MNNLIKVDELYELFCSAVSDNINPIGSFIPTICWMPHFSGVKGHHKNAIIVSNFLKQNVANFF